MRAPPPLDVFDNPVSANSITAAQFAIVPPGDTVTCEDQFDAAFVSWIAISSDKPDPARLALFVMPVGGVSVASVLLAT
jgi:hypothetical protein